MPRWSGVFKHYSAPTQKDAYLRMTDGRRVGGMIRAAELTPHNFQTAILEACFHSTSGIRNCKGNTGKLRVRVPTGLLHDRTEWFTVILKTGRWSSSCHPPNVQHVQTSPHPHRSLILWIVLDPTRERHSGIVAYVMTEEHLQTLRMNDQYKGTDKQITHSDFVLHATELHYDGLPGRPLVKALKKFAKALCLQETRDNSINNDTTP